MSYHHVTANMLMVTRAFHITGNNFWGSEPGGKRAEGSNLYSQTQQEHFSVGGTALWASSNIKLYFSNKHFTFHLKT